MALGRPELVFLHNASKQFKLRDPIVDESKYIMFNSLYSCKFHVLFQSIQTHSVEKGNCAILFSAESLWATQYYVRFSSSWLYRTVLKINVSRTSYRHLFNKRRVATRGKTITSYVSPIKLVV